MVEIWLPIPRLDGRYEASSYGKIRNNKTGRILKGFTRKDGYWQVCLQDETKKTGHKNFFIHQLVAEAFHGPCPPSEQVRHYPDRDLNNNRPDNLRYGSGSQNIYDAVEHGSHYQARKTHCPEGHEYTEENTFIYSNGARQCKICRRKNQSRFRAQESNKQKRRERRNPAAHDPDLLTTTEAAEFIDCGKTTITNLCLRGELPFVQVGSHRRIRRQDLLDYLQA